MDKVAFDKKFDELLLQAIPLLKEKADRAFKAANQERFDDNESYALPKIAITIALTQVGEVAFRPLTDEYRKEMRRISKLV